MPRLSHDGVNQQTFLTSSATPTLLSQQAQAETGNNALKRPFDEDDSNAHERPRIPDEVVRIDRPQSRPMKGSGGRIRDSRLQRIGRKWKLFKRPWHRLSGHLRPSQAVSWKTSLFQKYQHRLRTPIIIESFKWS